MNNLHYDCIVIGGGHAGCEAALASARLGAATLLITVNNDHIAQMSCNPAVGGVAKGHVVREIDACGGAQGLITDLSAIQFRMLNRGKGPAVWSPRAQCDKLFYQRAMKYYLEAAPNVSILQAEVVDIETSGDNITGVITHFGEKIGCKSLVICSGTSLNGLLHYGLRHYPGGRQGDPASNELSAALSSRLRLRLGRLKTGTPPRVLAKSLDFKEMGIQEAEVSAERFAFPESRNFAQSRLPEEVFEVKDHLMPCRFVRTNDATNAIVRENLEKAPLYAGEIKGIGARYCPSFEDKVVRFPHHPDHLIYLEPEGEGTGEYYLNGISTSLPPEVQRKMLATLPGFSNVIISRFAYAIEYDFIPPDQLTRTLRNKFWNNLFTAGQINGTSGYEEAAGQGLVAGLNAARTAAGKEAVEFPRDAGYIGVMIDDLVTKEIVEPYRLFTSRAEYRLTLRQDNADVRLAEFAYNNGLISCGRYNAVKARMEETETARNLIMTTKEGGQTLWRKLKDHQGRLPENFTPPLPGFSRRTWETLAIEAHYDGYIKRESASIQKLHLLENIIVPDDFDYNKVSGLCLESRQKLLKIKPHTLAQASRIDGVTPAELALLQVLIKRHTATQPGNALHD